MTHEQKIKALIEAGEKATAGHCCPEWMATAIRHVVRNCDISCEDIHEGDCGGMFPGKYDGGYLAQAANARDSIKLLAEIAEAAGELRRLETECGAKVQSAWREAERNPDLYHEINKPAVSARSHLDALLAKYKESQDAE